jgi:L-fuculose-phosphate aldolase
MEGLSNYSRSITVSSEKLGEEFVQAMGEKPACLMRGHGITTAGASVEEATLTAIKLNELAEVNYRASLLGEPQPISEEDIQVILGSGERRRSATYNLSNWRYYCKLLGE